MSNPEFSNAYSDNFSRTLRFLLSRGIDRQRAEEITQAAWCKAWERREQLREPSSAAAWVNTIALNLLRRDKQRAKATVELLERDEPVRSSSDKRIDAERALNLLTDEDRRLLLLHISAGLTSQEIAAESRFSAVAVRVRLHRVRRQLRIRFNGATNGSRATRARSSKTTRLAN